ncbi:MAG: TonB-dependent receptor domain-containing protein [Acidobacteriota bacterium]
MRTKTPLYLLIVAALAVPALATASGALTGVVVDDQGQPLPGVTVTVSGPALASPQTAYADIDGSFTVAGLNPGVYTVTASLDGFQTTNAEVKLVLDQTLKLEVRMALATFAETVEVKAEAIKTGEVAILDERRQAAVVSDAISSEEIAKTPDSDAAGVVERLTGVSIMDDKYVYVRGLGERYSNTTLNGSVIPTTEPEKRVVPLDLFPAKMLDTVNVIKSYTPDKPGDFGGGLVELATTDFPTSATLKVSIGASSDAATTGEDFRQYGGGLSWTGSGGQPLPGSIPSDLLVPENPLVPGQGYSAEQLETFGDRIVAGTWEADRPSSAPANGNFSVAYGNTFGRFGVVLSAVGTKSFDGTDEIQRYYGLDSGDVLVVRNDYEMTTDSEDVRNGLVGSFSFRLNDTNRLLLSSVFTRNASAETRQTDGYNANAGQTFRDYRQRYQNEEILSTRLGGEHNFSGIGLGSLIEWNLSSSTATNDQDLRETLYYELEPGVYALQGSSESGKTEFFGLEDDNRNAALSWTVFYGGGAERFGSLKVGAAWVDRTRDFAARRLRFITDNPNQFDLTLPANRIFTEENVRPGGFEVREFTGANDAYDAEHTITAGFAMADSAFGKWRFVGGLRYERSDQSVNSFDPSSPGAAPVVADNADNDLLPALSVIYQLRPTANLRIAASRTVNRPEFRELSPFQFTEVTGGRSVAGNPDLERALIDSFDVRYEWFPDAGEVVAVSAFFKRIDQPIERIIQPTTELRTSFANADSAELWGAEFEFRRSLAVVASALRRWSVNLNYAYVQSDVTIGQQDLSVVTNLSRPLEGQSEHVGNAAIQYYKPEWGTLGRLLFNYTGERITDVGAYGLPDILEAAHGSLDLLLSQELKFIAPQLELKLNATNLLDETRELTQGGEIHRSYKPGRVFGASLAYSFF